MASLTEKVYSPTSNLAVTYCNIEELHADVKNPRRHSRRQTEQIAASIKAFGFNVPFLVDRDLRLIAGHGRLAACKSLNIKRVPTICLGHLTKDQARAFMIADNRLTDISTWDDRLLAEELKSLSALNLDFNLEATGFEVGEIDLILEGVNRDSADEEDSADQIPEPATIGPVSEPGDLWLLGTNRLICGDALDEQNYRTLMDGCQAAAVITDPPNSDDYVTNLGSEFATAETELTQFLSKVFNNLVGASISGSLHFIGMNASHIKELLRASEQSYSELEDICVWVKDKGGEGSLYRSQHELVFVFRHGTNQPRNKILPGQSGRSRTNVWRYRSVSSKLGKEQRSSLTRRHRAVKPVAMVADAIMDCTAKGDIILDAFGGTGTTLLAAERIGRIAFAVERNPFYVDLAIRRWEECTGKVAILERSMCSFKQVREQKYEPQR